MTSMLQQHFSELEWKVRDECSVTKNNLAVNLVRYLAIQLIWTHEKCGHIFD